LLAQDGSVRGFTHAIYSGFPTVELARIIINYVFPNKKMSGVFHISSEPVSKYDLLQLIVKKYEKQMKIEKYGGFYQNLSLNSSAFRLISGYKPPTWTKLIDEMHQHYISSSCYVKP